MKRFILAVAVCLSLVSVVEATGRQRIVQRFVNVQPRQAFVVAAPVVAAPVVVAPQQVYVPAQQVIVQPQAFSTGCGVFLIR